MEIHPGMQAVDVGLFFPQNSTLIICDIHIGYEAELRSRGVLIPNTQRKLIVEKLEWMLKKTKPQTVIINGDLKHEFGRISKQEWFDTYEIIDLILKHAEELIIVEGNHDNMMKAIAKKKGIALVHDYRFGKVLIAHGDKEPKNLKGVDVVVMGHEHPAITLRDGAKREKYKCYLKGQYKRKTLIVQPSFQPLVEGTNVLQQRFLSPLLKDIKKFNVFIIDEKKKEVLSFGTIKELEQRKF